MADCEQTIRELDAFLDGELPDALRTHVDDHLGVCMDCLQAFDFQAELKLAVKRKLATDTMPDGLRDRILVCLKTDLGDGPPGEATA